MKKSFFLILPFIIGACLAYDAHDRWKGDWWTSTIHSDGYGYYAYLPCIFIQHNFNYDKIIDTEKKVRPGTPDFEASYEFPANNGKQVNRCFIGIAVLITPFFLLAYLLSYLLGYDLNGYSYLFQLGVSIAAITYLSIGLIYLRKLLLQYNISERIMAFTVITVVLGTNLFYYSTIEPSMTHVYSFCIIAAFAYYTKCSMTNFSSKNLLCMSAAFAMLILIRPTNLLVAFIVPVLAGDYNTLKAFFKNLFHSKATLLAIFIGCCIIGIQLIVWKMESGQFFFWSYQGEGFYFAHPKMIDILTSYRNGWFVYTPVMLIALISGAIALFRQSKFSFLFLCFFFLAITYVMSSWYSWNYGGYGHRGYIEFYAFFALLLGLALNRIGNRGLRISLQIICLLCVILNTIQTRQYTNFILSHDYMNKERYWRVFLKTGSQYVGILDRVLPARLNVYSDYVFSNGFEDNNWNSNANSLTDANAMNGRYSAMVNDKINDSPVFKIAANKLPQSGNLVVYVKFWAYMVEGNCNASLIVNDKTSEGNISGLGNFPLKDSLKATGIWKSIEYVVHLSAFKASTDTLSVFIHATSGLAYIDDMYIEFGTLK